MSTRAFDDRPARQRRHFEDVDPSTIIRPQPLGVGLYGCSGRGKSYGATMLAEGIQRVYGGEVYFVDTDGGRGRALKERFRFRYIDFPPPHNALDFIDLFEQYAQRKGVLVVDQMTEEHEGAEGLLEHFEREKQGMDSRTPVAWAKAKPPHLRLARVVRQTMATIPVVLTWRAKDKIDWNNKDANGKLKPVDLGEMPIGSEDLPFEMTCTLLLPAGGERGVPLLDPKLHGEKKMTKIPEWFEGIFKPGERLSAEHGEAMARWAMRDVKRVSWFDRLSSAMGEAANEEAIRGIGVQANALRQKGELTREQVEQLASMGTQRKVALLQQATATEGP